jgi:hypothetical protein
MRAGLLCLLGVAAIAACGRIGYESVDLAELPVDAGPDAPLPTDVGGNPPADAEVDFSVDVSAPDALLPDKVDAQGDFPDARMDVSLDAPVDTVSVTGTFGPQVGTLFTDLCPGDQVLVGFAGSAGPSSGSIYDNLIGRCGTVNVSSSMPYRVTSVPLSSSTLPARGNGQVTFASRCPPDQVVVGFSGRADPDLKALSFVCANLVVTGGPATYSIVPGSDRSVEPLMNVAGGNAFSAACPPGQLARGTHLWAGPRIQAFGLACGTVAFRP